MSRWLRAALGARARHSEVAVLVVGRMRSQSLNRRYRGMNRPTNVLSFSPPPLPRAVVARGVRGDLVICAEVLRAEARSQGKSERAHWAHLFVHGVLHLAGYDHQASADARRMERREVSILRRLGITNPYLLSEHG